MQFIKVHTLITALRQCWTVSSCRTPSIIVVRHLVNIAVSDKYKLVSILVVSEMGKLVNILVVSVEVVFTIFSPF